MDMYKEIRGLLLEGEVEELTRLIQQAINLKYSPEKILSEALEPAIDVFAKKFVTESVMVPEALIISRAFNEGVNCLKPHLQSTTKYKTKAVIGTVEGDIHDIGKNIIKLVISSLNIEIIDLGVNVDKKQFVEAIKKYNPQLVMISALLTTTVKQMKNIISEIEKENLRQDVIIFVGGAPVTKKYADEIGADYYTENSIELKKLLTENLSGFSKQLKVKSINNK